MNKQTLIDHLNKDLASELSAMIQYTVYSAKTTGPQRPQLSEFFLQEVPDEQGHAQFLANKVAALGGTPVITPDQVPNPDDNHAMLEAVLEAEHKAIKNYGERIKEANEYGDKGLAVKLEDIIADETQHAEQTERILRDWNA